MDTVLSVLEKKPFLKDLIKTEVRTLQLKPSFATDFSLSKLRQRMEKFTQGTFSQTSKQRDYWLQNELKTFVWVILAISIVREMDIESFREDEKAIVFDLFRGKSKSFLLYELKRVALERFCRNQNWSVPEDGLLSKILQRNDHAGLRWNEVGRQLFESSEGEYFRLGKHCRERWLNHLDPSKQRGDWTTEQDKELMGMILQKGKRWAEVAVLLNRTEHMTKNRYHCLLTRQKRITPLARKEEDLLEMVIERLNSFPSVAEEGKPTLEPVKVEEAQFKNILEREGVRKRGRPPKVKTGKETIRPQIMKKRESRTSPSNFYLTAQQRFESFVRSHQPPTPYPFPVLSQAPSFEQEGIKPEVKEQPQKPNLDSRHFYPFLNQNWASSSTGFMTPPSGYPSPTVPYFGSSFRSYHDSFKSQVRISPPIAKIEQSE